MGWRGTLRHIVAAQRREAREQERRLRQLERERDALGREAEEARNRLEVLAYEAQIEVLRSVHRSCAAPCDWEQIAQTPIPPEPQNTHRREDRARLALERWQPSFWAQLLGRERAERAKFAATIAQAARADATAHQRALKKWRASAGEWQELQELATRVLSGDPQAYLDVLSEAEPLQELGDYGSSCLFAVRSGGKLTVTFVVHGETVIPSKKKRLLADGSVSVRDMPETQFYGILQDYVCGSVLRVAREIFALLPLRTVIVNAVADILNTASGHLEEKTILSVVIPRATLHGLRFETVDASDSMRNFVHRMGMRKTVAPHGVEPLTWDDLQAQ